MAEGDHDEHDSVGAWAKKYYLTSRALIESTLREHDLGPTQWYVLHRLVNVGPTLQRDLSQLLRIERATDRPERVSPALVERYVEAFEALDADGRERFVAEAIAAADATALCAAFAAARSEAAGAGPEPRSRSPRRRAKVCACGRAPRMSRPSPTRASPR